MKLYGLFRYTYDFSEIEDFLVASHDREKLKVWATDNEKGLKVVTAEEHEKISNGRSEERHLVIMEITFI